jgi:DNA-binding GntR family transcriptional regulator
MQEHLTVIDAIDTRVPAAAVDAITAHILNAKSRALGVR